jgi:hypothetical protein
MSQNVTLPASLSAAQFRRAGIEALAPRFDTPFTLVYRCSKNAPKFSLFLTFRPARRDFQFAKLDS